MRFVTLTVLACLALPLTSPEAAAKPGGQPAWHPKARKGVAVASPNRLPAAQLAAQSPPVVYGQPDRLAGAQLTDRHGRVIGRAHPGFITHEPLVAARVNKLSTALAGLAPDMRCDGTRCLYGEGLTWGTNAAMLLVYGTVDCSGRPAVSYHPSVAGFDAIAFAVQEPEGRFIHLARNAPDEMVVRSWRLPAETTCQRDDAGQTENVLPLEAVYPAEWLGEAPLRWR